VFFYSPSFLLICKDVLKFIIEWIWYYGSSGHFYTSKFLYLVQLITRPSYFVLYIWQYSLSSWTNTTNGNDVWPCSSFCNSHLPWMCSYSTYLCSLGKSYSSYLHKHIILSFDFSGILHKLLFLIFSWECKEIRKVFSLSTFPIW